MDSKELQQIVACGETSTVQFKEHFSNQDSIAAEMVAMSNACKVYYLPLQYEQQERNVRQ